MTEARLLEGKILAAKIQDEIKSQLQVFASKGLEKPRLSATYSAQNSSAEWYVGQQEKLAQKLGIEFEKFPLPETPNFLEKQIVEQSIGKRFHGIFIAMPLPAGFDSDKVLSNLDGRKDVEGIHPLSLGLIVLRKAKLIPPTAFAAFKLIESAGIEMRGKRAVIVGQSAIVGKPLAMLLGEKRATVTICNTGTSAADLEKIVSESDIVVGCAGQPGLIKGGWIKPGAVVIDVGTTEVNGKLVGDVEFEEAKKRAGFITPVPGGVGPLTVTMLMQNLIYAYKWQKNL